MHIYSVNDPEFKSYGNVWDNVPSELTSPVLDDRDVILFPEKIGGKFAMMHRPKQFVGERYGVKYPSIWLKFSDDLLAWEDKPSHLLIAGREGTWEEKIGGSTSSSTANTSSWLAKAISISSW